jgi:hypothetical protein
MSGPVWMYTPQTHTTEHHGRERRIYFGPAAQAILRPWLRPELTAYVFNPREAMSERQANGDGSGERLSLPPNGAGGVRPSRSGPRESDTILGPTLTALSTASGEPTGRPRGSGSRRFPNGIRINSATTRRRGLRREFGLDVARAVLGHSSPAVTEVYAELDGAKAAEAMERVG